MARNDAPAAPLSPQAQARRTSAQGRRELLVVDGYNVIFKGGRYASLMDEDADDPFVRARELLISDVAAYAHGRYDAVVVFDAAGNVSPERPNLSRAGIGVIFSARGETADDVIERLVTGARLQPREVSVVTSDKTIRATVGGVPVTRISSDVLVHDVGEMNADMRRACEERSHQRLTIADRLDPQTRARLDALLGRG